jgi:sialidase-1
VFVSGRDGYHTYRILAMVVTNEGTLLAFCEGRKTGSGDHEDVDLAMKRSEDNGGTWSAMAKVWGHQWSDGTTIGNPCAVVDEESGRIWLAMYKGQFEVFITCSDDDGRTWTKPRDITTSVENPAWDWPESINTEFGERIIWASPGIGIQLKHGPKAGRLIIPCHMRPKGLPVSDNRMWVFYSDDHGANWQCCDNNALGNESQIVQLSDNTLMLNGRNQNKKGGRPFRRLVSYSFDGGITWSNSILADELLESICQASILRYTWPQNGQKSRILFSNPADQEDRVRMTVRLSYDEGKTWPVKRVVHPERCEYSCLTVLPDATIGLLFKGDRKIMFTRFSLAWLVGEDSL